MRQAAKTCAAHGIILGVACVTITANAQISQAERYRRQQEARRGKVVYLKDIARQQRAERARAASGGDSGEGGGALNKGMFKAGGSVFWPHYLGQGTVYTRGVAEMPVAGTTLGSVP